MKEQQRKLPDRRKRSTPFISRYTFWGRRRQARRSDESQNYYVDRIHPSMRKFLWGILCLAIIDGFATLYGVYYLGVSEANPLMASALNISAVWFLVIKYGVTVVALVILLLHQFFRYVRFILSILFAVYAAIVIYHALIFASHLLRSP